ncbi:hypothetical protein CPB84DRAFT_1852312 [Gymnopilus junonius]|uniref:Protein transport protein SEC31 n=1 Tax=Gymnopilus junonius TaxID=109634 RepID=A0A9P5NCF5_GYMJU|nr:hypothetical protein CPB84DRAFT_1852312 [Gymnopilus junonius]
MKLKEIHRTSTFAWSPASPLPLLATGTVAGALDESFSNESQLEIWAPDFLDKDEFDLGFEGQYGPKGSVKDTARFNRLAWGYVDPSRPQGVIAAGLENGELALWDPAKILSGAGAESLILRNTTHTGPVRGLDFNPLQNNLFASGGVAGEVYIWDLKDPSKPYTPTPGQRSTKLDEITSVAWNQQVQYVLAGASSTGYTVVWDLRGKREVVALAYGGGAGTHMGNAWRWMAPTRLVTASEDDSSPVIMVWDLRNARAPEKILTGHEKGVLSLSWCKQDADLLLSCGKDNRALCWNPQTSEIIGELPSADNWAFQVDWCPRNPDMLATAFFDGTIGIHSIQTTNESAAPQPTAPRADGADIFDAPGFSRSSQQGTLSLKQPPKWLRRPVSSTFGFGGKLVTVSNLPNAQGKVQSNVVHLRKVVTENEFVERAKKLESAMEGEGEDIAAGLQAFVEEKSEQGGEAWKALLSLFKANSREELVTLLGYSKAEIAARAAEAVEHLKAAAAAHEAQSPSPLLDKPHESVVSFAEPESQEVPSDRSDAGDDSTGPVAASEEATPSEVSAGITSSSDTASVVAHQDEAESATTAPSLFGDDIPATPQHDFFNTVGVAQDDGHTEAVHVPHMNYGLDSSVAATLGSGRSSVASASGISEVSSSKGGLGGTGGNNVFRIYPAEESDVDKLVTKALVLGDFESAVSLCLAADKFADAILLAARSGPELLQRTQKAYFERRAGTGQAYLRLLQSIVSGDLGDIVQNADLEEWREIFVVICTFAGKDEFAPLAEQLGRRLEYRYAVVYGDGEVESGEGDQEKEEAYEYRKHATLTYLAAARLERLISIWADEMAQEEKARVGGAEAGSYYSAHAHALQTFIEKVTVFRAATNYKDDALEPSSLVSTRDEPSQAYKLAGLYDRYFEYADLLCDQGLLKEAVKFLKLTPGAYKGSKFGADLEAERKRLVEATNPGPVGSSSSGATASTSTATARAAVPTTSTSSRSVYGGGYAAGGYVLAAPVQPAVVVPQHPQQPTGPYAPAGLGHQQAAPPAPYGHTAAQPGAPSAYGGPYIPSGASLSQPPHLRAQPPPPPPAHVSVPAPPPPRGATGTPSNALPPPPKRENGGWNDAPNVAPSSRAPAALNLHKPAAITSPFPNATPSPGYSPQGSPYVGGGGQASATLPPPPRPGSVNRGPSVPPGPPPPHRTIGGPPRSPSVTQPPHQPPPPSRMMSPPMQRQPTPGQGLYAPPQSATLRGPAMGQTPPPGPGQFNRAPPPPALPPHGGPGGPGGPHGQLPPPPHAPPSAGPYTPAPNAQPMQAPPPPSGPYAPQQRPGPSQPPQQQLHHQPPPPTPQQASGPPPPGGPAGAPPRTMSRSAAPARSQPPPPKYPVGDRSHIPDYAQPAFVSITAHLNRVKQTTPANQKRLVDDLERRINPLFDALNCETLSRPVVDQLVVLTRAMDAHDRPAAQAIHVELLTRGSQTDDIGLWMSGVKQLILTL